MINQSPQVKETAAVAAATEWFILFPRRSAAIPASSTCTFSSNKLVSLELRTAGEVNPNKKRGLVDSLLR